MKPRNESTGKRVAAIAGKVLRGLASIPNEADCIETGVEAYYWVDARFKKMRFPVSQSVVICTVRDLKALAASALTQSADKKERKP